MLFCIVAIKVAVQVLFIEYTVCWLTGVRHWMNRCQMVKVDSEVEKHKTYTLTLHNASVWVGG